MPSRFAKFKHLERRMRRTMHYGRRRLNCLTEPLSKYVVDYFNKNVAAKSDLDMDFVVSFSERRCINPCTLLVAIIYVERLKCSVQQIPTTADHNTAMCCRDSSELFVMALVLATKFLNDGGLDEFVWNDEFADASDFTTARINKLELELLDSLDWNLIVDQDAFDKSFAAAEYWIALDTFRRNGFLTYNEINALCSDGNFRALFRRQIEELVSVIFSAGIAYLTATALLVLPFIASIGQQGSHSCAITQNITILEQSALNAVWKLPIFDTHLTKLNEAGKKLKDPELMTVNFSKRQELIDPGEKTYFWLADFYWMNNARLMARKSGNLTLTNNFELYIQNKCHFVMFSEKIADMENVCY